MVVEHGGHGGTTAAPIVRKVLEVFFEDPQNEERRPSGLRALVNGSGRVVNVGAPATR
jgi:hypothetical protein